MTGYTPVTNHTNRRPTPPARTRRTPRPSADDTIPDGDPDVRELVDIPAAEVISRAW